MPEIENKQTLKEVGSKRFYVPAKLKDICPACGKPIIYDFSEFYLSYPKMNEAEEVSLYCEDADGGCGHEWSVKVILRITLDLAE